MEKAKLEWCVYPNTALEVTICTTRGTSAIIACRTEDGRLIIYTQPLRKQLNLAFKHGKDVELIGVLEGYINNTLETTMGDC